MKLRCELHLENQLTRVILVAGPTETVEHLAMKLAAVVMFHDQRPIVEPSGEHPALSNLDLKPDVMTLNEGGDIVLWIDCGAVSINKLDKVARRLPSARVIVIKKSLREATQLRDRLAAETRHADRIEIWTWPENSFASWLNALGEKTEIFGEASERSFNLVVNETAYHADLVAV